MKFMKMASAKAIGPSREIIREYEPKNHMSAASRVSFQAPSRSRAVLCEYRPINKREAAGFWPPYGV